MNPRAQSNGQHKNADQELENYVALLKGKKRGQARRILKALIETACGPDELLTLLKKITLHCKGLPEPLKPRFREDIGLWGEAYLKYLPDCTRAQRTVMLRTRAEVGILPSAKFIKAIHKVIEDDLENCGLEDLIAFLVFDAKFGLYPDDFRTKETVLREPIAILETWEKAFRRQDLSQITLAQLTDMIESSGALRIKFGEGFASLVCSLTNKALEKTSDIDSVLAVRLFHGLAMLDCSYSHDLYVNVAERVYQKIEMPQQLAGENRTTFNIACTWFGYDPVPFSAVYGRMQKDELLLRDRFQHHASGKNVSVNGKAPLRLPIVADSIRPVLGIGPAVTIDMAPPIHFVIEQQEDVRNEYEKGSIKPVEVSQEKSLNHYTGRAFLRAHVYRALAEGPILHLSREDFEFLSQAETSHEFERLLEEMTEPLFDEGYERGFFQILRRSKHSLRLLEME